MRLVVLLGALLAVCLPLRAQSAFGKNRLLTRGYNTQVWETDHFLIHYYETNPLLIEECAKILESAHLDLTERLDVKPAKKIPFFLYTNHNEFEQTRVVDIGEGTGGVTEAFKDRLLIFNSGSLTWLRHVIYHEFTHSLEFSILNAGFWKSARLVKSILYPLWLMEGLAEYMAGSIDETTDAMYARDAATSKKAPAFDLKDLHNFNHLKPNQITRAYKQGAMVVSFIAEEYGEEKLGEILKSFWSRYDITSVLIDVLGVDLTTLNKKFAEWLEENYGWLAGTLDESARYADKLTQSEPPIPVFRWAPQSTPDGKRIYFIALREGFPAIYELDLDSKKQKILVGRAYKELDWIALEEKNLALSGDGRYLYFVGEKNLKEYIYRYDLTTTKLGRQSFGSLMAYKSPAVNPKDPNEVAFAAMENGFNDLYLARFDDGTLTRVTHDPRDEDHPVFSPDGDALVFSAEMPVSNKGYPNRDLFIWSRITQVQEPIVRSPAVEKTPTLSGDGQKLYFISDADGVWNLYELDRTSQKVYRRTRVVGGVFSPVALNDGAIVLASFRDGEIDIYKASEDRMLKEDMSSIFEIKEVTPPPPRHLWRGGGGVTQAKETPTPNIRYLGPYRTRFGTDLIFPAFFFSTQGGLFALLYWQGSDLLGYHSLANQLLVNSASDLLDYTLSYSLNKYRPGFEFIFKGTHYADFNDLSVRGDSLRKKEHLQAVFASYPLDRFNRLEAGAVVVERYHHFPSEATALTNLQDLRVLAQYARDTTTAPYLVVTRGSRFLIGGRKAVEALNFDMNYLTSFIEWDQYVPAPGDSVLASRARWLTSSGPDAETFPLGGQGNVRGFPFENPPDRVRHTLVHNLEFRFPVVPELNYHMWFMFPDFYIKNIYLGLFSDQGVRWRNSTASLVRDKRLETKDDFLHSVGLSVKFNTFILETFPFFFSFEWAKRTTGQGSVFYGSVFQFFKF